jgi:tetraacyldisaccharide 4'-kinase
MVRRTSFGWNLFELRVSYTNEHGNIVNFNELSWRRRVHDGVREFYFGSSNSKSQRALRWTLAPLTALYSFGRSLHQQYRSLRKQRVNRPVVSVGNLSLGGTGKTPFVKWLVDELIQRDFQPGILKRGEGEGGGFVPRDPNPIDEIARTFGDEVTLLRNRFPEIPIYAGTNRVEGARKLAEQSSADLLLLDDGFQYRCLHRDLDVVLLRPSDCRNSWQLPAGPLREPLSALRRADFVSLYNSGHDQEDERPNLPSGPICLTHRYEFSRIERNGRAVTDEYLREEPVLVTTLARPGALEEFLHEQGFSIKCHVSLPDHSSPEDEVGRALDQGESVLLTEKEWIKLSSKRRRDVGVIQSRLFVEPSEPLLRGVIDLLPES